MTEVVEQKSQIGNPHKNIYRVFIIFLVIMGFITTFISGYFMSRFLFSEKNVTMVRPNPTSENPQVGQASTKFLPGKHYFNDTIMIVTKDKPRIDLVATVTRIEQDNDYTQNTRVSYYDGSGWIRQSDSKTNPDSTIVSDKLVKSWGVMIDPSRVLKQTVQGEITISNSSLAFSTGTLQNEIGIRSLP